MKKSIILSLMLVLTFAAPTHAMNNGDNQPLPPLMQKIVNAQNALTTYGHTTFKPTTAIIYLHELTEAITIIVQATAAVNEAKIQNLVNDEDYDNTMADIGEKTQNFIKLAKQFVQVYGAYLRGLPTDNTAKGNFRQAFDRFVTELNKPDTQQIEIFDFLRDIERSTLSLKKHSLLNEVDTLKNVAKAWIEDDQDEEKKSLLIHEMQRNLVLWAILSDDANRAIQCIHNDLKGFITETYTPATNNIKAFLEAPTKANEVRLQHVQTVNQALADHLQ